MADSELEAIRARRMAELQGGQGSSSNAEADAQRRQEEEARQTMLSQILTNEARERIGRIALVRPERASAIEGMLMRMAKMGQIRKKVTEEDLKGMLEELNAETAAETTITYSRKDAMDDSDDEEYDF
ncbi:programmed cell death protein 5-like protein [Linderina pennispora]|uniref:Programmed cell death protein 5-like protein n=1 Tax=Linderina pennispora TaxID=61395 RepID=A0A1Y1W9E6_9FUNG|nr:programmed cell death protein 5-like protein [Linderina pennispora]ORX70159.1 programmed cell death protein 5-like protein [Linderina pennispora]